MVFLKVKIVTNTTSESTELIFIVDDTSSSETRDADTISGARNGRSIGGSFSKKVDALTEAIGKRVSLPTAKLKEQIGRLVKDLTEVFDHADQEANGKITLNEVELTVEVNTEGQLGILGSGGKVGGKGGITLKFKRN